MNDRLALTIFMIKVIYHESSGLLENQHLIENVLKIRTPQFIMVMNEMIKINFSDVVSLIL